MLSSLEQSRRIEPATIVAGESEGEGLEITYEFRDDGRGLFDRSKEINIAAAQAEVGLGGTVIYEQHLNLLVNFSDAANAADAPSISPLVLPKGTTTFDPRTRPDLSLTLSSRESSSIFDTPTLTTTLHTPRTGEVEMTRGDLVDALGIADSYTDAVLFPGLAEHNARMIETIRFDFEQRDQSHLPLPFKGGSEDAQVTL